MVKSKVISLSLFWFFFIDSSRVTCQIVKDNYCLNERLDALSSFVDDSWDFCGGELEEVPASEVVASYNLSRTNDLRIVFDTLNSEYYAFFAEFGSSSNDKLWRLDFGNSLSNVPTETEIEIDGIGLVDPDGLEIVISNGNWYGFLGSVQSGYGITRLDFGSSLGNIPAATNIGSFSVSGSIRNLTVLDNRFLVVLGFNPVRLEIIDYSNGFENPPTSQYLTPTYPELRNAAGFDFRRVDNDWIAFVVSINDTRIIRLNFGSDLLSEPLREAIYDFGISQMYKLRWVERNENHYFFVTTFGTGVQRIKMEGLPLSIIPEIDEITSAQSYAFDIGYHRGSFEGMSMQGSSFVVSTFDSDCGATTGYLSESFGAVSYNTDGPKVVSAIRGVQFFDDTLQVQIDSAPGADFSNDNLCIAASGNFIAFEPGLMYTWNFGDGSSTQSGQNTTHIFPSPGTYTVRLDVNDGICDNFTEQEITIFPEPPVPVVAASELTQCLNTTITFTNTTDESQHPGVLTYAWDFDNDGTIDSTEPSPAFAYTTPGPKTVSVTSSIPGCESAATTIDLTILDGPTSDFFATTVCDGEAVSFTNTSQNAISYLWDFQDGVTSTNESPDHVFPAAGSFFVELVATDANGCEDTETIEVLVLDNPEVNFDFGIVCTSMDGNSFQDQSTVNNSDIVAWNWTVDGMEASTEQNPTLLFETPGVKSISLSATSANGCESSYTENINVLSAPVPNFTFSIGCVGEGSSFTDASVVDGSTLNTWVWDVNGTSYLTQDISHVFDAPGMYEVTLEVGAQNFCSESITRMVQVLELPVVQFDVTGGCDNEVVLAMENATSTNDPILSRQWLLDGSVVGNGDEVVIPALANGNYEIALNVETENGCAVSTTQQLIINNAPESSFSFNKFYGVLNETLTFTNESNGATAYQWLLDGVQVSESALSQTFAFSEAGDYEVSLVALNTLGCSDTVNQNVIIREPEVDLRIRNFDLIEEGATGRVLLEIENLSNLPIDLTNVRINLENQLSVKEAVEELILSGESRLVALTTGIPLDQSEPAFFCVTIESQFANVPDQTPINNERCITIEPAIVLEDPFPNPVFDQTRVKLITPTAGNALISLLSSSGKVEWEQSRETSAGLNNFFIDLSNLNSGIYFITIRVNEEFFRKKVVKL